MTGWIDPIPTGTLSQDFGPSPLGVEGPAYADARRAHDADNGPNGNGQGPFPGSTFYQHFHAAIDISAPRGTAILAPESGVVMDAMYGGPGSWANGGGNFFRVAVNESCMYLGAHCEALSIKAGQRIARGQVIAHVGSTGVATGPHLHFWVRLGPRPYYDPGAFYYDPELVLPGGDLHGDSRFSPLYENLPDTALDFLRADGDPAPMRWRSEVSKGQTLSRTIQADKPIREGWSVSSKEVRRFKSRKAFDFVGRIPKEDLPQRERKFGDVLFGPVYVGNGHVLGYVKQVDLAGN